MVSKDIAIKLQIKGLTLRRTFSCLKNCLLTAGLLLLVFRLPSLSWLMFTVFPDFSMTVLHFWKAIVTPRVAAAATHAV